MLNLSSTLLLLAVVVAGIGLMSCKIHYIVPSQSDCNPSYADSCLTLSKFTDNSTNYINSNTTLFFVGGNHDLDKAVSVSNIAVFSMLSINDVDSNTVVSCGGVTNFTSLTLAILALVV